MRGKFYWRRLSFFSLLAAALILGGCGDDGSDGKDGIDGVTTIIEVPAGVDNPAESCAVCHDTGSVYSAEAAHEFFDMGAFDNFAVTVDGADLLVSFSVEVDGAPATDATFYRAYTGDGTTRTTLTDEIELDPTLFTNNGDGTYEVRIVDGVARFGGDDLRYLVILKSGDNELEVVAYDDYPNPLGRAGLASNMACINCHGESGEVGRFAPDNRGGHYSAPMTVDACVVCHRSDDPATVDDERPSYGAIAEIIHGIHNSHNFPDGEFLSRRGTTYDVTYPTYMTNCSVCHSDSNVVPAAGVSALAAANAMPVTGPNCFSCHGDMTSSSFDFSQTAFHNSYDETTACIGCHTVGGIARVTVAEFHNGLTTGRGGIIWDGVDTSVTEGAKFDWQITGIVDDGVNLAISWEAEYDGLFVDPCNATVGAGAPVFHADGSGNLSMLRSYAQGDDFILGQSTSAPGQANAVNVTTTNTTCAGFVATTTIPVDDVDADRGIVALQGKPRVVSVEDPAETMSVRAVTPTREWVVGTGALPTDTRRLIADTDACLKCHVGSLYQHGGNRVDNVDMCILCHNSASNEQSVRVGLGVDASEAYDGKVGETFEMKTMLHRIHAAGVEDSPTYLVYRNRGIYAFGPDESAIPNWPGTGPQVVYGSEGDMVINHNFHSATYPRALNACVACHDAAFDFMPDPTKAMATTVDAGSDEWINQLDDKLQGATTTACITCHTDSATRGHAYQNGWVPQEFPEGRQTIIDAAQ